MALFGSTAWMILFLIANSVLVERTADKLMANITEKGADVYARFRNRIKKLCKKLLEDPKYSFVEKKTRKNFIFRAMDFAADAGFISMDIYDALLEEL